MMPRCVPHASFMRSSFSMLPRSVAVSTALKYRNTPNADNAAPPNSAPSITGTAFGSIKPGFFQSRTQSRTVTTAAIPANSGILSENRMPFVKSPSSL